jgi:hypothetical protein
MLLSGCGGDGGADETSTTRAVSTTTTTVAVGGATPLEVVTAWLDALSIGRSGAADQAVVQDQFVLLLAIESYSLELYNELVSSGISAAASRNFWESFSAGVRGFTGADITEVEVLGENRFEAYGGSFAAVEGESPRGDLTIVAIQTADGRWLVDLLATFGPSFAPLFNLWIERLPADATAPLEALAGQLPSLQVARDRAIDPEALAELDRLIETLSGHQGR